MTTTPDESVAALQEAGLTYYQARAYSTLIETGPVRVLPLARASGVPRNKLYHVLADLERLGLVHVTNREPLTYGPRPLRPFLEARIDRLQALVTTFNGAGSGFAHVTAEAPEEVEATGIDAHEKS